MSRAEAQAGTTRAVTGRERGAVLVETAVVFPLLLLLIFGAIDFGRAHYDRISLNQGVREGARRAAVGSFGSSTSCSINGAVPSPAANLVCTVKERAGLDAANTRVKVVVPTGYLPGDDILVCAAFPVTASTPLIGQFLTGRRLHALVTMRAEYVPAAPLVSGEEAPLAGDSWSWCA